MADGLKFSIRHDGGGAEKEPRRGRRRRVRVVEIETIADANGGAGFWTCGPTWAEWEYDGLESPSARTARVYTTCSTLNREKENTIFSKVRFSSNKSYYYRSYNNCRYWLRRTRLIEKKIDDEIQRDDSRGHRSSNRPYNILLDWSLLVAYRRVMTDKSNFFFLSYIRNDDTRFDKCFYYTKWVVKCNFVWSRIHTR